MPKLPVRVVASLVHLSLSIMLVASVLAVAIFLWYPGYYFDAMGVGKILLILAAVDVSIGPLITLIIYNPAKKSLKFDLTVIALLQLAALLYGVNTVFVGRPVFSVFNGTRFTIVTPGDILDDPAYAAASLSLPMGGPKIIGAQLPSDPREREKIMFSAIQGGPDLPQMSKYYVPYSAVKPEVKAKMMSLDALMKRQPPAIANEVRALIEKTAAENKLNLSDVGFVPLRGKKQDLTAMVRRSDAEVVTFLPIDPWGS